MRKLSLFVLLLLGLSAAPAAAQTIGFKIGPTFSKMDIEDAPDDEIETLTSFGGGGFIRFGAMGLNLQAELLAVTKGFKTEDPTLGEGEFKLTYVEVPVTALLSFGAPYVFAGPYAAFEVSCDVEFDGDSAECDENDGTRKETEFGLVGGAGLHIPMGPGNLLIEGRYSHGLTDINDDEIETASIKNRYWAIMAGYAIRLGL